MAPRTTVNAASLEALGAPRLAALLLELSAGDSAAQRRLRLELAGNASPAAVGREVRKRLATIARTRGFVDWPGVKAFAGDLETQRRAVVEQVARHDPMDALDLMWRFLALANGVFARCDDSNGVVGDVFRQACRDLGPLATAATPDPAALAAQVFAALVGNEYGQVDESIAVLAPALGPIGLSRLKDLVNAYAREAVAKPKDKDRRQIGWSSAGPIYEDEIAASHRQSVIRSALEAIADATGDVDAYIAQQGTQARAVPGVAAQIAQRLLAAGRPEEALRALDAARPGRAGWETAAWDDVRLEVLEALGRADEAQDFRWACFTRTLSGARLRDYLKRLPVFDDAAAEERAIAYARDFPNVHVALEFLMSWPAPDQAAALVMARAKEIDGNFYELLSPAAAELSARHALAATVLLRAMIDFTLGKARASRYRYAARHLGDCGRLAAAIPDFQPLPDHTRYVARLKAEHGRKSGFWSLVPG